MKYPGLGRSLKHQLTINEWAVVEEIIQKVDSLAWNQGSFARTLLEEAVKKAVANNYYHCAACILHYYELFYTGV